MSDTYVTVGTIQVELDSIGKPTDILVTPIPAFTVEFDEQSYIVLLPFDDDTIKIEEAKTTGAKFLDAKFAKLVDSRFLVSGYSESVLIQVALKRTVVEIHCKFESGHATIKSLKIPAVS